jgi:hypothetical protein
MAIRCVIPYAYIFATSLGLKNARTTELLRRLSTEVVGIFVLLLIEYLLFKYHFVKALVLHNHIVIRAPSASSVLSADASSPAVADVLYQASANDCRNTTKPETITLLLGYSRRLRTLAEVSAFPLWP